MNFDLPSKVLCDSKEVDAALPVIFSFLVQGQSTPNSSMNMVKGTPNQLRQSITTHTHTQNYLSSTY